jgi:hypothetical protein
VPLQCNIDARGKLVRLVYGLGFVIAGVLLMILWARGSSGLIPWLVSIGLTLGGCFAIFESRKGWCVLRAMGWKTSI